MGREKLEVVPSCCLLGDCLFSGGGCELAAIARCRVAWGKFNSSCPSSPSAHFSSPPKAEFTICVSGVPCSMQAKPGPHPYLTCITCKLQYNDRAMIRWMCRVTTKDQVSLQDLLERMQLDDLAKVLRIRWLRLHGHVECSDGWLKKVQKLNPTRDCGRGRPKKTWTEVIDMDCLTLGLTETRTA